MMQQPSIRDLAEHGVWPRAIESEISEAPVDTSRLCSGPLRCYIEVVHKMHRNGPRGGISLKSRLSC